MTEQDLDHARTQDLERVVETAHILVTTGAGGVGKTTTAAALGVAGARAGRRTLVLTIDPARRLAQSMGLDTLDNVPRQVVVPDADGELFAMMLDMQSTFDHLIERHAKSQRSADVIKANRIYQTLSSTLSGTQEYMAMEKLHELHEDGEWDLLIVDTPPTRSALDFLDAPKRMTGFLEGSLLKLFLKPGMLAGKGYLKAVNAGASAFMKIAGRVTGMELLQDMGEFFRNFEGMYEGFKERAEQVLDLLQEPTSQFVIVTSPQPPPLREAKFFLDRIEQEGLHAAGVVVNRIDPLFVGLPAEDAIEAQRGELVELEHGAAILELLEVASATRRLAERERRDVNAALFGAKPRALVEVPLLRSDVHDLETLSRISSALVGAA